jgi:hypothetical protein
VLGIIIAVTAEDQSVRQYVVTVQRTPPDPNNFLADLSLTVGGTEAALSPAFAPGRFLYVTQVPYATAQVTVLASPQSRVAGAALELPPAPAGGRAPAVKGTVQAKPGATVDFAAPLTRLVLSVAVTAQDGGVQRYTLDLRRAEPDHNPDLASLTVSAGTLVPVFTPRIVSYNLALPAAADSVEIKAAAASPVATIAVAEQPNVKPAAAQSLTLAVAAGSSTTITFVVSAEDGTQKLYMVRISRASAPAALDGNSLLQSLVVSGAQLAPAFDASVAQYDARLAANVESVTVTAVAQSQLASVSIDGQAAAKTGRAIAVAAGSTKTVFIDVTAQNGAVTRYSLRLTREAAKPPEGGQTGGGTTAPPPAGAGPDHVVVTAKNLRLQTREAAALTAAGDTVGTEARITVRYYRTNDVITQYTAAVDVKQQGSVPSLTFSCPSAGVTLDRSRMIEVEVAVATAKGRFLFYTEAQPADDQVSIEVPFLLYGPGPQVHWPAVGSAVQLAGYISKLPLSKARAMDAEDFGKDAKGEYAISVQILDAGTGAAIGTATVSTKPGQGRSRTLSFASGLTAPEGTTVKYVLSARAKNGKVWSATGTTAVWTTTMRYPAGFQPVLILVEDDLAPEK